MSAPVILVVTGGRHFNDAEVVNAALDRMVATYPDAPSYTLYHGCASGADTLAIDWLCAQSLEEPPAFERRDFPADWRTHGKAAGPIRNREMCVRAALQADAGHVVEFICFPGGKGTTNCWNHAVRCGLSCWFAHRTNDVVVVEHRLPGNRVRPSEPRAAQ